MIMPNGIALSPDRRRLYVAETHSALLWAWEITAPGEVRRLPWPSLYGGTLVAGAGGYAQFDSIAVTASGRICVAMPEGCSILEAAPDGAFTRHHPVPDLFVTNLCFGGVDLRTAFVPLSYEGRLAAIPWHEPGLRPNYQF